MSAPPRASAPDPAEVWSTGDYADVCDRMIPGLGARLVELAGIRAGGHVLDVAAGTGNASLPAARAGARVTALDITPQLLQIGAQRSADAGLEIEWVHGDAQRMPYADGAFDHVLSCVGVQFCPDQRAAARELGRVCRAGGTVALAAWTPGSFIGQVLAAIAGATGADPARPGPLDWGREDALAGLLRPAGSEIAFHREHVDMPARSAEEWVDYMAQAYGPMVRARRALEAAGGWEPLRARLAEIADGHDGHAAEGFAGRAEYLVAVLER